VAELTPERNRLTVLYVAGVGRSGSTLLERMLASLDGFVPVGEVVHLNDRGIVENQRCGCGEAFADCPFWTKVGDAAFGGWAQIDGRAQHELRRSIDRNRFILRLLWPSGSYRRRVDEYVEYLAAIYRAIDEVGGDVVGADVVGAGTVVVDTSKHPSYALLLRRVPNVDLRVVHMVRRPEGVAHSWAKSVARPEITDRVAMMPRYGAARIALRWNSWNLLVSCLRFVRVPVRVVRYEDLVADPATELMAAGDFAGRTVSSAAASAMRDAVDVSRPLHSVAGNPMRFERQAIKVRADEGWRVEMPASRRRLVSALTWPIRLTFGYGGTGPRHERTAK
jgi:hypothetical protein